MSYLANTGFAYVGGPSYTGDLAPSVNAAFAETDVVFLLPGTYSLETDINVGAGKWLFGAGYASVIDFAVGGAKINLSDNSPKVTDLRFTSALVTSDLNYGLLSIANTDCSRPIVQRISCNAPTLVANFIQFALPNIPKTISEILVTDNVIEAIGRMGIEILAQVGGGTVKRIRIRDNYINDANGPAGTGMGISLTCNPGQVLDDYIVQGNSVSNVSTSGIEIAGSCTNGNVSKNHFSGTFGVAQLISSNVGSALPLEISGNISEAGSGGFWQLASCPGAVVHHNVINADFGVAIESAGVLFTYNTVNAPLANYAVIVDGAGGDRTGCVVENNALSTVGSATNFSVLRFYGTGATACRGRFNSIQKGTGGVSVDQFGGAAGNYIEGNYEPTFGLAVDNSPRPHRFVFQDSGSPAHTITFDEAFAPSSWEPVTIRVTVSGCQNDGGNQTSWNAVLNSRVLFGVTAPSEANIVNLIGTPENISVAVTPGPNSIVFTPTPTAGTPNLVWTFEIDSLVLPPNIQIV